MLSTWKGKLEVSGAENPIVLMKDQQSGKLFKEYNRGDVPVLFDLFKQSPGKHHIHEYALSDKSGECLIF